MALNNLALLVDRVLCGCDLGIEDRLVYHGHRLLASLAVNAASNNRLEAGKIRRVGALDIHRISVGVNWRGLHDVGGIVDVCDFFVLVIDGLGRRLKNVFGWHVVHVGRGLLDIEVRRGSRMDDGANNRLSVTDLGLDIAEESAISDRRSAVEHVGDRLVEAGELLPLELLVRNNVSKDILSFGSFILGGL